MTKGLGMALAMYSSCLPMFNGRRTFSYDRTKIAEVVGVGVSFDKMKFTIMYKLDEVDE
jgi:hypothetical protein